MGEGEERLSERASEHRRARFLRGEAPGAGAAGASGGWAAGASLWVEGAVGALEEEVVDEPLGLERGVPHLGLRVSFGANRVVCSISEFQPRQLTRVGGGLEGCRASPLALRRKRVRAQLNLGGRS